jgi:hypothetical protein
MPFSSHLRTWEPQAVESAQAAGEYSVFVTLLNDLQKRGRFRMDLLNLLSNVWMLMCVKYYAQKRGRFTKKTGLNFETSK